MFKTIILLMYSFVCVDLHWLHLTTIEMHVGFMLLTFILTRKYRFISVVTVFQFSHTCGVQGQIKKRIDCLLIVMHHKVKRNVTC